MDFLIAKRSPCCVCNLDTFRHQGWYLAVENRWLDRLKVLSWNGSLATQGEMKSVCCRQHLKTLVAHWLERGNLQMSSTPDLDHSKAIGSGSGAADVDLGRSAAGRLLGELTVHRESFSGVWTGSPAALEGIMEAFLATDVPVKPHGLEFRIFAPRKPTQELLLQ